VGSDCDDFILMDFSCIDLSARTFAAHPLDSDRVKTACLILDLRMRAWTSLSSVSVTRKMRAIFRWKLASCESHRLMVLLFPL
jgi:hypothetical protein